MSVPHLNTESYRKRISSNDFTIVTQKFISDEYIKADAAWQTERSGITTAEGSEVEQVPLVLSVKGPISLRRTGFQDVQGVAAPEKTYWYTTSYRTIIGKTGVV